MVPICVVIIFLNICNLVFVKCSITLDSSGSEQGIVAGSCEHGNERSVFIKDGDFMY